MSDRMSGLKIHNSIISIKDGMSKREIRYDIETKFLIDALIFVLCLQTLLIKIKGGRCMNFYL